MNLSKRQWFAVVISFLIAACFANALLLARHCSDDLKNIVDVVGGLALAIVIFLVFLFLLQCGKCIFCLNAEPIILVLCSGAVFGLTLFVNNNKMCKQNSNWIYTCISALVLSLLNAVLSCCF